MNLLHNPVKINEFLANQKIRFSYLLGLSGLEPPTSRLSGARSNQLSYKPVRGARAASLRRSRSCNSLSTLDREVGAVSAS